MGETESNLSDMPHSVRPIVPPPPPNYSPAATGRITGPLKLRDTRPLAWTEAAQRLGQVEPMALQGVEIVRRKGWSFKNQLEALRRKIQNLRKP